MTRFTQSGAVCENVISGQYWGDYIICWRKDREFHSQFDTKILTAMRLS